MNSLSVKQVSQRERLPVPTSRLLVLSFGCSISQKFISETVNEKEKQKQTRVNSYYGLGSDWDMEQEIITVTLCQDGAPSLSAWGKPLPGRVVPLDYGSSKFTVSLFSSSQFTHLCRHPGCSSDQGEADRSRFLVLSVP